MKTSEMPSHLSKIGIILLVFIFLGCIFASVYFCLCGLIYNVTVTYFLSGLVQCNTYDLTCLFSRNSKGLKKSQMMASDASHMLEAALEQMDDIIAGIIMLYFTPNYFEIELCLSSFAPAIFCLFFCFLIIILNLSSSL